jgi:ADP-ribose pyrophosphatase
MEYKNPKILFKGKRVSMLSVEAEHPKGGVIRKEVVDHPGAVVILPLLDEERVILLRNERPVVQETLWELPAGTLEAGESPQMCASRELEEEAGYRAGKISHLLDFFSTPGFCNEKLFCFLAEELVFVGQNLDDTEKIEVFPLSISQALEMIKTGIIRDAKTISTLLYFTTYCRGK